MIDGHLCLRQGNINGQKKIKSGISTSRPNLSIITQ